MATRAASVRDAAIKTGETCATKLQDGLTTTTQTFAALMTQAEEINRDRAELGEEATLKLLTKCQANVRALCMVEAQQQAHKSSLAGLRTELPEEVVPAELQRVFAESLKKHTEAHASKADVDQRREMRRLRALMTGEAAEEGMDEGGDEGDDDVMMTQQTITNIKCPILQMPMRPSGDMRPMTPKTGHASSCVYSFQGISSLLKRGASCDCPMNGCNAKVLKGGLVEAKEMLKKIKEMEDDGE
uniref:SP-RING-type domain-containing protein n=1 Tax=Phaeocystis antarctica TaxID=33657 RepID=A0A7S0EK96_9EUKA|mmetsp:Transcript_24698/g.58972  ORF Transcript_24698/g.58972 Transcript_24698/m.58972 type:complete len:244 (+) Transcript_24698:39-770(+)